MTGTDWRQRRTDADRPEKGALKIMGWTQFKTRIAVSAGMLLAAGATAASLGQTNEAPGRILTLKVNPEVLIRNVMARAEGTMNTPSAHYSDILLDVLQMEGFDPGTNQIAFDTQAGEITTRNTPEALERFRQIVGDLNREDGERTLPLPGAPLKPTVLVTCGFYKMSAGDFERLGLDLKNSAISENGPRFWEVKPGELCGLKRRIQSAGGVPFQSPQVQTAYGCAASVFVGDARENTRFKCLPLPLSAAQFGSPALELRVQAGTTGKFSGNPAGDWPDFAGVANCAVFARAGFHDGGGLIFRVKTPGNASPDDLVLLVEAHVESKPRENDRRMN